MMRLYPKKILSGVLLAFLCIAPVSFARAEEAATVAELALYKAAQRALAEKRYEDALAFLEGVPAEKMKDPIQPVFMRGMALLNLNRGAEAAAAFRSILEKNPGLLRVRLELARSLFSYGDASRAEHHFNLVLAANVPHVVATNIQRFLNSITGRQLWFFDFNVNIAEDNNVNQATDTRVFFLNIFGQRLPFTPNETPDSGEGLTVFMRATRLVPLDVAHAFHLQAYLNIRDYAGSDFDDLLLSVSPSLQYTSVDGGSVRFGPFVNRRWQATDFVSTTFGFRLRTTDILTPKLSLQTVWEIQESDHQDSPFSNAFDIYGRASLTRQLGPGRSVGVSADARRHRVMSDASSYNHGAIGVSHGRKLPLGFNAFVETKVGRRVYRAGSFLFGGKKRHDTTFTASLTLSNDNITFGKLLPALTAEYTKQNSSQNNSDYNRTVFSFSMRRQF